MCLCSWAQKGKMEKVGDRDGSWSGAARDWKGLLPSLIPSSNNYSFILNSHNINLLGFILNKLSQIGPKLCFCNLHCSVEN